MSFDPDHHHRRSIRLRGFDYRTAGAYFVTIATQDRARVLGEVRAGTSILSHAGQMVHDTWRYLPRVFPVARPDAFVVMPDHVHAVFVIADHADWDGHVTDDAAVHNASVGADLVSAPVAPDRWWLARLPPTPSPSADLAPANGLPAGSGTTATGPAGSAITTAAGPAEAGATTRVAPTVGGVVSTFKSLTTLLYAAGVHKNDWPPFRRRLWQRNYYEHIVRDEADLWRIRAYIRDNPARWSQKHTV